MKVLLSIITIFSQLVFLSQERFHKSIEEKLNNIDIINATKITFYETDSNGIIKKEPRLIYENKYDKYGNLIQEKKINFKENKNTHKTHIYTYNSSGKIINKSIYSNIYNKKLITKYKYSKEVLISSSKDIGYTTEVLKYDSKGNITEHSDCTQGNCRKIWTKEYDDKNNVVKYIVYKYNQEVWHLELYEYDSLNRLVKYNMSKYNEDLEDIYDSQGDQIVDYIFLSNNNECLKREIKYFDNYVQVNYFDKFNNIESNTFKIDKNGNSISVKGNGPTKYYIDHDESKKIFYDLSNRIIKIEFYYHDKLKYMREYQYN